MKNGYIKVIIVPLRWAENVVQHILPDIFEKRSREIKDST
jgi:hypothetical protein